MSYREISDLPDFAEIADFWQLSYKSRCSLSK